MSRRGGRKKSSSRGPATNDTSAEQEPANPFSLPSDEEVFILREQERKRKKEERNRLKTVKIWEKTTQSSRLGRTTRIKDIVDVATSSEKGKGSHQIASGPEHRREKENMAEFIAKKREMFLVQMSLDTKREEIRKLEEKAKLKEEALRKSEIMLEEDAIRFDTFLKENDKKAHEAIKRAEAETKKKQEKMQEIKKLKQSIQLVQSEMSKLKEQLDLCENYKEFLDSLTPEEWFEEQASTKTKRQEARRLKRWQVKHKDWDQTKRRLEEEVETQKAIDKERAAREGKRVKRKTYDAPVPAEPQLAEELLTDSDSEEPMYFEEPQQLLDIFTALEESNLFLIQNSQETEQALEELKQDYMETKTRMDAKTALLKDSIEEHLAQIAAEEAKADALKLRADSSGGKGVQEQLLKDLHVRIQKVFEECENDSSSNPTTLSMLTDLEGKLEQLLSEMELMDPEYVEQAEKAREKERREKVRLARMKKVQDEYEERLKRSMARAAAPVEKKKGKQVMYRSQPFKKKKKRKDLVENTEDTKDARYLS